MTPRSTILLAATFAVAAGLAACAVLGARFDALPDQVPVTRWGTVAKSVPTVFRVPGINLVTIALLGLLARATLRAGVGTPSVAVLFFAAGLKAILEALELALSWPLASLVALTVLGGIVLAGYLAREFWRPPRPNVPFDSFERRMAVALVAVLLVLQFVVPAFG